MNNIAYRRVKQNDLQFIRTLFYQVFNRKISTTYYNWAYLDRNYFSFVALANDKIIGHVGFLKKDIFYNEKFHKAFLRHSSFVLKKYRRKKIYTNLCNYSFKKIINQNPNNIIITFPNSTNFKVSNKYFKNFYHFNQNKIIFKKAKTKYNKKSIYNHENIICKNLKKNDFNDFFIDKKYQENMFFYKDLKYFKKRFLTLYSEQYSIFYLKNNNKSFLIFKKYHNKIIIMDYFGEVRNFIKNIFNLYIFLGINSTIEFWGNNKLFNKINKFSYSKILEDQNIGILTNKKIKNFNLKKILNNNFLSFGDTDVYNKIY